MRAGPMKLHQIQIDGFGAWHYSQLVFYVLHAYKKMDFISLNQ